MYSKPITTHKIQQIIQMVLLNLQKVELFYKRFECIMKGLNAFA